VFSDLLASCLTFSVVLFAWACFSLGAKNLLSNPSPLALSPCVFSGLAGRFSPRLFPAAPPPKPPGTLFFSAEIHLFRSAFLRSQFVVRYSSPTSEISLSFLSFFFFLSLRRLPTLFSLLFFTLSRFPGKVIFLEVPPDSPVKFCFAPD